MPKLLRNGIRESERAGRRCGARVTVVVGVPAAEDVPDDGLGADRLEVDRLEG